VVILFSKNKKGLPKFNMPLEVWEGLVFIVEEMETHEQIYLSHKGLKHLLSSWWGTFLLMD
jgi:hypothetical protein